MGTVVRSTGEMFGALFPIVSPVAALPVFLSLTARQSQSEGLQIAGGIIVGLTGLRMVTADVAEPEETERSGDIAFSPLATPLLAGPGALGVLMGLEARRTSEVPLAGFVAGILLIAFSICVCFALGGQLARLLGPAGIDALNRLFGLLVMAIGVEMVVHGIAKHQAFALGLF